MGQHPNIRLATLNKTLADEPQWDAETKANYVWAVSSPPAFVPVLGANFSWPSAVCYLFGLELNARLEGKVPIGLISSAWGGQRIETFSSPDALADKTCGGVTMPDLFKPRKYVVSDAQGPEDMLDLGSPRPQSSQIWYSMITPLLNFQFTGVVWYQGEANHADAAQYACRFPAMIADWRKKFNLPDLMFLFVQLAPTLGASMNVYFPQLREAQMVALQLPRVGYAVAIDLGDAHPPFGSVHPRRKFEVGRRLAAAAMHIQYDATDPGVGPVFKTATLNKQQITLTFQEDTAFGLHFATAPDCDQLGKQHSHCCSVSPFETEVDGEWTPALKWSVSGTEVQLTASGDVTAVRFDWAGFPGCVLLNGKGGPDDHQGMAASPFWFNFTKNGADSPLEILI